MPVALGIVVALKEELAAVEAARAALPEDLRARVRAVRGGVGGAAAAKAARQLFIEAKPALLASSGFSGGLVEDLPRGAVVLGAEIRACRDAASASDAAGVACDPAALARAQDALTKAGLSFRAGILVTVAEPVFKAAEKRALGQAAAALAVDMEAAAVARFASEVQLPFLALRAISDTAQEDLPEEVGGFLSESGDVKVGNVAKFVLRDPRRLGALMRLKAGSDEAAKGLSSAWGALLPALIADL
ncbi:MAG: hypothetical protein M5U26_18430 [Planctomycetota bacterium]|nr:hypothetical protein [Planctomycetota bacterium]